MSFIGKQPELATDITTGRAVAVLDGATVPIDRRWPERWRARHRGYDPVRRRFVPLDRPADGRFRWRYTLSGRQTASEARRHRMAIYLPYGRWGCADGRVVYFNRYYEPVLARAPDGAVSIPEPTEWVRWVDQSWFYTDDNPPWLDALTLDRVEAVLRSAGGEW